MRITDNINARCFSTDIETTKSVFYIGCFNGETGEEFGFEISKRKNQLFEFVEWYLGNSFDYTVTYNGVSFDCPVLQFVIDNHQEWAEFNTQEIIDAIYRYSQHVIEESNNGRPTYRESSFSKPTIDVFTILGLNNLARFQSLKGCEFALQMPNLQTMPIHHTKKDMTDEEIQMTIDYCGVDLEGTWNVFLLVLGLYPHPLYEGKNQLQLRFDILNEFELSCLNYSDIKIGEELMKLCYAKEVGKEIKDLPKKGTFRKDIKLKECIPSYVKFTTPNLKKLLKDCNNLVISQNDSFEKKVIINKRIYTLAKGGLHADQKLEVWQAGEDYFIEDDDASSYYPKILINNNYYPKHLGKELLKVYTQLYEKRIELKPLGKKDKRIQGIVEALKLVCNSVFGKLGSMDSWLFDAKTMFSVTLTGEFNLLMLIEMFEENGINVISANSDGVTTRFHKSKKELKDSIVKKWQEITNFEIETVRFKTFYYSSVNDYLAIKDNDEIKVKGEFVSDFEIYKNSSMRVVPLALQEYFKTGMHPKDFITSHKNIYDFCIRVKATGDFYLEEEVIDGSKVRHNKMLRYYISNEGNLLFKRGFNSKGKEFNGWVNAPFAETNKELKMTNFNKYIDKDNYDIDYSFYVIKACKTLDKLLKKNILKNYLDTLKPTMQISMPF